MIDGIDGCCGFVKIKNMNDGLWYRRFCILQSHTFTVYKDENLQEIENSIKIDSNVSAYQVESKRSPRFMIHTPSQEILISVDFPETLFRWVTSITTASYTQPSLSMDDFNIISVIGKGFYGKVMLVQLKKTGEVFALKTVQKKRLIEMNKAHTIIAERNSLMRAKHPFIVRLCFAFQTPAKFYLGLEYASGGELFYHMDRRGALPLNEVRLIVAEICLAISYLHSLGIVYRDLKPENVMLDCEGHVKLTDFGLSKDIFLSNSTATICGTTEYLSPEVVMRNPYDYGVDWWALGILMYEMLTDRTPFDNPIRSKMLYDIVHTPPEFPENMDPDAVEFIKALLQKESKNRPNIEQIKKFKLFECYDWDKVYRREYTPEFVPTCADPLSPVNFDIEFTEEHPIDSPVPSMMSDFPGFSYTALPFGEEDENL